MRNYLMEWLTAVGSRKFRSTLKRARTRARIRGVWMQISDKKEGVYFAINGD